MMNQTERLHFLISYMLQEKGEEQVIPKSFEERFKMYRGLANERPAKKISREYLDVQDMFLRDYNKENIVDFKDLEPIDDAIYLWQGDITTLKIDAIVNAANVDLIGCLIPNHNCIDNIIHTKAGLQLRLDCAKIIAKQGRKEAVGRAKITDGYNLPASFVLHTVGPVVTGNKVSPLKRDLLKKCYTSCLQVAEEKGIENIAFCSISTGVFGYPKKEAAEAAIEAVKEYKTNEDSNIKVVFNVFDDEAYNIYENLLK